MYFYDGPTWTIECSGNESYVFDNEESALWFQKCRSVFKMAFGCMARDDGNFFMDESERDEVLKEEPKLAKFIQNVNRFCLWLVYVSPADIRKNYLLIPRHSSEQSAFSLEHATPYHFGILTSRVHVGWMRYVCGRDNDAAVCEAYGLPADMSGEDIVMPMFRLYYDATGQEWPEE